jgi:hypothetical protein
MVEMRTRVEVLIVFLMGFFRVVEGLVFIEVVEYFLDDILCCEVILIIDFVVILEDNFKWGEYF